MFHVSERHAGLLPDDENARARAISRMFSALDTREPSIWEFDVAPVLEGDRPWHAERVAILRDRVRVRLCERSARLGEADCLDPTFSAGDLLMVTVLRRFDGSGLLEEFPRIGAHVACGEARPDFRRAFDAQQAVFTGMRADGAQG